jgi:hypothetical protein
MDAARQLLDIEAIKRLKSSYFLYVDTKQWDAWLDLFTPDGSFQWDAAPSAMGRDPKTGDKLVGREALSIIGRMLEGACTVHIGHSPIIDLVSETEARGIWGMEDIVEKADESVHGWGHYHEVYRKTDGGWRIQSSHLRRLRVVTTQR